MKRKLLTNNPKNAEKLITTNNSNKCEDKQNSEINQDGLQRRRSKRLSSKTNHLNNLNFKSEEIDTLNTSNHKSLNHSLRLGVRRHRRSGKENNDPVKRRKQESNKS